MFMRIMPSRQLTPAAWARVRYFSDQLGWFEAEIVGRFKYLGLPTCWGVALTDVFADAVQRALKALDDAIETGTVENVKAAVERVKAARDHDGATKPGQSAASARAAANAENAGKIVQLSLAPILAETIRRVAQDESVSAMYKGMLKQRTPADAAASSARARVN